MNRLFTTIELRRISASVLATCIVIAWCLNTEVGSSPAIPGPPHEAAPADRAEEAHHSRAYDRRSSPTLNARTVTAGASIPTRAPVRFEQPNEDSTAAGPGPAAGSGALEPAHSRSVRTATPRDQARSLERLHDLESKLAHHGIDAAVDSVDCRAEGCQLQIHFATTEAAKRALLLADDRQSISIEQAPTPENGLLAIVHSHTQQAVEPQLERMETE